MLSLLGLYNYDSGLFDKMKLPGSLDRNIFINNLLAETAEFEILYADVDFMKNIIEAWSEKEVPVWNKLEETLFYEYDPISNYDRNEQWEDSSNNTGKVAAFNSEEMVNSSGLDANGKRSGRAWGNIGVTTTQQMIEEQRKVVQFNLTNYIIEEFKKRFCILIY